MEYHIHIVYTLQNTHRLLKLGAWKPTLIQMIVSIVAEDTLKRHHKQRLLRSPSALVAVQEVRQCASPVQGMYESGMIRIYALVQIPKLLQGTFHPTCDM